MSSRATLVQVLILSLVILGIPLQAVPQEFFADKTVRLIAGFPPGGGVDTDARLISRYIGKHIPGNPTVLVVNMPGAGGRIALTHVSRIAKRDGLTWMVIPITPTLFQILDKDRKFDLAEMTRLAGSAETGVTVARDLTGIKSSADVPKADPTKLVLPGRSAPDTPQMALRAALEMLGIKSGYKVSFGYPGTAQITAALLQGEATFYEWAMVNVLKGGILYDAIQEGKVIPVWQTGFINPQGQVVRDPRLEIPTFFEVYQKIAGKAPSGVAWDTYKMLGPGMRTLNRSVVLTPGVPANRVKILREAFDKLRKDPEYLGEIKRILGFEPQLFSGEAAENTFQGLLKSVTPEILSYMKAIMQ